jgi:T5orf172 domain
LESNVKSEVEAMLQNDELLLGSIFRAMQRGITNTLELAEVAGASNRGVVYNYQKMISAILTGPNSASISRNASRSISRIIKNSVDISPATLKYLNDVKIKLEDNTDSASALLHDQEVIEAQSTALGKVASTIKSGIYVYSFPTYLYYGTVDNSELFWLKLGSTKNSVWQRILEQNRQTSMPEDPILLRIYHQENMDIDAAEKLFHTTLSRVGHERSTARRTKAGTEWFATTLDAIDALAELMHFEIERYEGFDK